ncbi:Zn-dependent hydrolase, partial [Streptomyces rubellomurinus subsp. indigoferus]
LAHPPRPRPPMLLPPADRPRAKLPHPERQPDGEQADGQRSPLAGTAPTALHTPGNAPGAVCLDAPHLGTAFTDYTLFHGGPGATGRSFSHFPTIIESIRERLLSLP